MSPEKLAKIIELARYGIGGEKENAQRICTKYGVDWNKKVKESFIDKTKSMFGGDIQREYTVSLKYPTDMALIDVLANKVCGNKHKLSMRYNELIIKCTQGEMKLISENFNKLRREYADLMNVLGKMYMGVEEI